MATETHTFELFADYHLFFLRDEAANSYDPVEGITDQDMKNMFLAAPGTLAVRTVRNLGVLVTVELQDFAPDNDTENWNHVVDASIATPSGKLFVTGFWMIEEREGDVNILAVAPSVYRARIFYGNLDKIDEWGIEGDDHYRVVLWPGDAIAPRVVKRWARVPLG